MRDVENATSYLQRGAKYLADPRIIIAAAMLILVVIAIMQNPPRQTPAVPSPTPSAVPAANIDSRILYTFNTDGVLDEAAPMSETKSPYWWLDSGGQLITKDGVGETIQGDIAKSNPWYQEYADTNAEDTDGGLHPQNLLRLVSRSTWDNVRVEASYYIVKDNLSTSSNRNESNGLLLMSRYTDDGQTLYYAGIRVDGTAVIKKKYKGTYYTMAQGQIFPGTYSIKKNSGTSQNLLPHHQWIRLASETSTERDGSVSVRLFMQDQSTKKWNLLLSAQDTGQYDKTAPITGAKYIGLRTDFMDVKFDDILMEKL